MRRPSFGAVSGGPFRLLGATTLIGLVTGALVGGVGGRLAMRLLFLTSDPRVDGLISDDGFEIGQLTGETVGLVLFGGFIGVLGAFTYLGVRPFLMGPRWLKLLGCAIAPGALVGGLIINPDGVDFSELSPLWLAIGLFVLIPALFGVLTAIAVEWSLRPESWVGRGPTWLVAAPAVLLLIPPLPILIGLPFAGVYAARWGAARWPRVRATIEARWALWTVRLGWAAAAAFGGLLLVEDIAALY